MKIAFLGAGSTIFAKNVLGDIMLTPEIKDIEIALHDIDSVRLEDSFVMLNNILKNTCRADVTIIKTTNRRAALKGSEFVVNAIQVGGYEPCTVTDFEIPKKFGLRQTIADTLGIGGIFRALRTIPVMHKFAEDINDVCPNALFLNYTNPMSILTGYMQRYTPVNTVGLCHSVQVCVPHLLKSLDMDEYSEGCTWDIAGINHQAWLLKITDKNGTDLYPEIKKRAASPTGGMNISKDLVRLDMMQRFGYYITESSEHNAEYTPWYIKSKYPELIEKYNIPLDEYPRRCVSQIEKWNKMREDLVNNESLEHKKTNEYAAGIIKAVVTDEPFRIHGNVLNTGLITNLPQNACVEVACMVDRRGISPTYAGNLPEQCAAINRTNVNVHLLAIEAAVEQRKELVYMAAALDPHTAAELSLDDIKAMCDELFEAHKGWIPKYK